MSQIGRIGGQVLTDNLLRAGVDLAFETDLLYLNVGDRQIGINDDTPSYDLDVNSTLLTNVLTTTSQLTVDGIRFTAPNTITSTVAPIEVFIAGPTLFHDRLITSNLEFDDNFISSFSNSNIIFNPNGSGTIELFSDTFVTGVLQVTGNIQIPGDLRSDGTVTFGDNINFDTVTIAPDLTQHIVPGDDVTYDIGTSSKRWRSGLSQNVDITTGFVSGNLSVTAPSNISVVTGNILINIADPSPTATFTSAMGNASLQFQGNLLSNSVSGQNIRFNPNGGGAINLEDNTNVNGNLGVSGNILLPGDLSSQGTITIGDQTLDTVTINLDLTQSIVPGDDITYAMGADASDSSPRRWAQVHSPDWTNINSGAWSGSGIIVSNVYVSDQTYLDGTNRQILATQSNDDIALLPASGLTSIEKISWQNNDITNLINTPLTIVGTGIGYTRIVGNNAMVVPSGTDAERRLSPEIGETRWNTDQDYLECFDGSIWTVSIGGGGTAVTLNDMDDFSNIYTLILG